MIPAEEERNKEGYIPMMSNLHEDVCLLSTQITLQALCHEIWGKR